MATSDERREVARKLREASACGEGISCCSVDKALELRYDDDYFGDVFECESVRDLADLIDPTCEVVMEEPEGDAGEFVAQMLGTVCSECGGDLHRDRFTGAYPAYCPHCGARVVDDDVR